jgi:hypothetical protein
MPLLFTLDRNPQVKMEPFGDSGAGREKTRFAQVTRPEHFTAENFDRQFCLTETP